MVSYKIVTKMLVNNQKLCLDWVIFEEQRAFTPSRQIGDNVSVAFEVVHKINSIQKGE